MNDSTSGTALPFSGLRVLAVSPVPTHPTTAGNRARLLALLERLRALGATVHLVHVRHESADLAAMKRHWSAEAVTSVPFVLPAERYGRWNRFAILAKRFLRLPIRKRFDLDDWCSVPLDAEIRRQVEAFQPHAVLMVYIWFSAVLESLPDNVLKVLDAQDVFTDRAERMRRAGIDHQWFSVSRKEEARALARFDVILAIQELEAAHFRQLTSGEVATVGHFLPELQTGLPSSKPSILIVASNNPMNVDGVTWFLRSVWPLILASKPDATLQIAGTIADFVSPQQGVEILGVVEQLESVYSEARLVVNPLRGGTGLKRSKSAEALAAGRAVVSTSNAIEGLEAAVGRGIVVADGDEGMAHTIVSLLDDDEAVHELGAAARRFAELWNAEQDLAFRRAFSRALEAASVATASPAG